MEDRQGVEEFVVDREIHHSADLGDVGQDGAMRQHDAFGLALRAGSEQHHGWVVGLPDRTARLGSQRAKPMSQSLSSHVEP